MPGEGRRLLAVIPARGGSKGLPGKNIRPFVGLPLIAHSIHFARMCPEIDRCLVSTDSGEIAAVARSHGGDAPFLRPADLATDESPIFPALTHALGYAEREEGRPYDYVALLDPTSPGRIPSDISEALARLHATPSANGIIGVSEPDFNPIWHCVVERDGRMADLIPAGAEYMRRQDVPRVYRINAVLYIWRSAFIRSGAIQWRRGMENLLHEVPESRAIHIDTLDEFQRAELLVRAGLVTFPWLPGVGQ